MQLSYEDLDREILGVKGNQQIMFSTKVDNTDDMLRCDERAESHTRPQLQMLTKMLQEKKDKCVSENLRQQYDDALRPLLERQARYDAIKQAAIDARAKKQKIKEEEEFREMMANWVVGVDGDQVENSFLGIATWQVENAHERDLARERWKLRKKHKDRIISTNTLPLPIRYLCKTAVELSAPLVLRMKLDNELPKDILQERTDELVDVLWDWQGEVDIGLCDAYGCETFEDLPDAVQDIDLADIFIAGRNKEKKLIFASPNLISECSEERPWTPTPLGLRSGLSNKRRAMLRQHLLLQRSVKDHVKDINVRFRCEALIEEIVYKFSELDEQGNTTSSTTGKGGNGIKRPKTFGKPPTAKSKSRNFWPSRLFGGGGGGNSRKNKVVPVGSTFDVFPTSQEQENKYGRDVATPLTNSPKQGVGDVIPIDNNNNDDMQIIDIEIPSEEGLFKVDVPKNNKIDNDKKEDSATGQVEEDAIKPFIDHQATPPPPLKLMIELLSNQDRLVNFLANPNPRK
mmetsp:Transcript_50896/g.65174  ORF Transcript_50896/g.65174 Transcript_50896/m.65174 type:complete len:515 (-) Transcript_50896:193-1737(-)